MQIRIKLKIFIFFYLLINLLLLSKSSLNLINNKKSISESMVLSLTNLDQFPKENNIEHILSITGKASDTADTDIIKIGIKVETLDRSLLNSYRKNTNSSNYITKVFKKLKIPLNNLTTKEYNMVKSTRSVYNATNNMNTEIFEGYRIINEIEITLIDINKTGKLIEEAMKLDHVLISKINFEYSKKLNKEISKRLLQQAAIDASERAKTTAKALDLNIKDVKSINEQGSIYEERRTISILTEAPIYHGATNITGPVIYSERYSLSVNLAVNFIISKKNNSNKYEV